MPDSPTLPTVLPAITPSAREQIVARLTESFAQDRISLAEFERRVAMAFSAETPAALTTLTADLMSGEATSHQLAASPLRIDAVLGTVERGGFMNVPRHLDVRSFAGSVELDMSGAQFAPGVTEIELHNTLGNIEIRLPAHVQVEIETRSLLSSVECRGVSLNALPTPGRAPVSTVRLTGRAVLGVVQVEIAYLQVLPSLD